MNFDELMAQPARYRECQAWTEAGTRRRRLWDLIIHGHIRHVCTDHRPFGVDHLSVHHCSRCRVDWPTP